MAVERFGQDAGGGSFADTASTREQVGVGDTVHLYGVDQGFGDGLLADDLIKMLRAPFSRYYLIGHVR